jgi:hypothetical protein
MINQNKFRDNINFVKYAGKTTQMTADNVSNCLKQDSNEINDVYFYFIFLNKIRKKNKCQKHNSNSAKL